MGSERLRLVDEGEVRDLFSALTDLTLENVAAKTHGKHNHEKQNNAKWIAFFHLVR